MKKILPISVVIPTLGSKDLYNCIKKVNSGNTLPKEIIISIPKKYKLNKKLKFNNIKILRTNKSGQVSQRIEGFKIVKNKIIMQLDDDIFLKKNTMINLYESLIKKGKKNVVGPFYFDRNFNTNIQKINLDSDFFLLKEFYKKIICKAKWGKKKMGTITPIGINYGVDPDYVNKKTFKTEWLAGGCVLGYKEDLIKKNYFPFDGKAYAEDVINSLYRKRKKISHYVVLNSSVGTTYEVKYSFNEILQELRVRYHILKLISGSKIRFFIWCFFEIINKLFFKK